MGYVFHWMCTAGPLLSQGRKGRAFGKHYASLAFRCDSVHCGEVHDARRPTEIDHHASRAMALRCHLQSEDHATRPRADLHIDARSLRHRQSLPPGFPPRAPGAGTREGRLGLFGDHYLLLPSFFRCSPPKGNVNRMIK